MPELACQQAFDLAVQHHQAGRLNEAEQLYRQILAQQPNHAGALHYLGMVIYRKGQHDAAVDMIRQAIAIMPNWPDAYSNLAGVFQARGQLDQAITAYRQALALQPNYPEVHYNLGIALQANGQLDEAIAAWRQAISFRAHFPEAHYNLGNALAEKRQPDQAIAAYRQAVALKPDNTEMLHTLARVLEDKGLRQEALATYQQVLRLKPDDQTVKFDLAAMGSGQAVSTMPVEYIRSLFDGYATKFDEHLVNQLGYFIPQEMFTAVRAIDQRPDWDVLDLGCGTGLCGALFRPCAKRLVGVDLSPRMLERATARKIYDELIEADITVAMRNHPLQWTLLLAGDMLIYVGDLSEVFPAASAALRAGGLFAFSVEKHDGDGFFLHSGKRFAHSLNYLRDLARCNSFEELAAQATTIRQENSKAVEGWLVILRKLG